MDQEQRRYPYKKSLFPPRIQATLFISAVIIMLAIWLVPHA
jgi:hypothetical protein